MRRPLVLFLTVLCGWFLAGCGAVVGGGARSSHLPSSASVGAVPGVLGAPDARRALGELTNRAAGSLVGYDRSCATGHACVFGPAWKDVDKDGCNQRDQVLRRDLVDTSTRDGSRGCVIVSGTLRDPYTLKTVPFSKDRADEVQIDHVVALADAWRSGASGWNRTEREKIANDLINLRATIGTINLQKSDRGPGDWRPPAQQAWCWYAATYVTVKTRYRLSVTPADAKALETLLTGC